jgi:nitroreductase
MTSHILPFDKAVRHRFSARAFLPDPLSALQIEEVLQDAQLSPSNCNTQPWHVHIVSGETKDALSAAMIRNDDAGKTSADFTFAYEDFY